MRALEHPIAPPARRNVIQIDERCLNGSIPDRFDAVSAFRAANEAVRAGGESISYAGLERRSRALAGSLAAVTGPQPQSVGLLFDRGIDHFAAMIGALRCGHRFVPLEPGYPAERLRRMLADSGASVVITDAEHAQQARELVADGLVLEASQLIRGGDEGARLPVISPDRPAMIMYTSGSTGAPKGVVHSHRSLLHNCLRRSRAIGMTGNERSAQLEPASYIPAVTVALLALMNGATLCPFRAAEEGLARLVRWLRDEEITNLRATPTLLRAILQVMPDGRDFPSLRSIQTGGEPVRSSDIRAFLAKSFPNCSLAISYSTTETGTVAMAVADCGTADAGDPVSVGRPLEGVSIEIRDATGTNLPDGAEGAVIIRSRYLSPGYWNRPEETSQRFVKDEPTGEIAYSTGDIGFMREGALYHLGRSDQQVKVSGHRIECGEIESAIMSRADVSACAVVPFDDAAGATRLAAYVVCTIADRDLDPALREWLLARLPSFSVPAVFIPLGAIPENANAKLDRARLPDPRVFLESSRSAARAAPASTRRRLTLEDSAIRRLASTLADVWQDVLAIPRPGLDDCFFRSGGDSLAGMQLSLELHRRFSLDLPMTRLFEANTIRKQAMLLSERNSRIHTQPLVALEQSATGAHALLCIPGIAGHAWMFRHLAAALHPDVNVIGANFPGMDDSPPLDRIEDLAQHYINSPLPVSQGASPSSGEAAGVKESSNRLPLSTFTHLVVGGYSFGGLIAYELARQLRELNAGPSALFLWDCFHPAQPAAEQRWLDTKRLVKRAFHVGTRARTPLEGQFVRLADSCRRAARRFRDPPSIDLPVFLYMTDQERARRRGPTEIGGWERSCRGPIRGRRFAGQHIDLFRQPAVVEIAAAVREDLATLGLPDIQAPRMDEGQVPNQTAAPVR
jgi:amino acid adenylation domain-containing protein